MHYQTTSDPKNRKVSKGLAKRKCFKVIHKKPFNSCKRGKMMMMMMMMIIMMII